uniref:Uncharacterized protein n=1 Tax=Micrurus corallinus TaxID=54390 RepID=A0A2D4GUL5_MICCO
MAQFDKYCSWLSLWTSLCALCFPSPPPHNTNCKDVQIWAGYISFYSITVFFFTKEVRYMFAHNQLRKWIVPLTSIFHSKHVAKHDIGWESSVDWPSKHKNCCIKGYKVCLQEST